MSGVVVAESEDTDWGVLIEVDLGLLVGVQRCSGSLIAPTMVLTAGHCLFQKSTDRRFDDDEFEIVVGRYDLTDSSQGVERTVVNSYLHESYLGGVTSHDIAILEIEAVPEGYNILPIAKSGTNAIPNISVFGYGAAEEVGDGGLFWIRLPEDRLQELRRTPDGAYISYKCDDLVVEGAAEFLYCVDRLDPEVNVLGGDSGGPWAVFEDGAWLQYLVHSGGGPDIEAAVTTFGEANGESHYEWIKETANLYTAAPGVIVRDSATGDAWLVADDGKRRWIPDGDVYACLQDAGHSIENVSLQEIQQIPDWFDNWAACSPTTTPEVSTAIIIDSSGSMSSNDPGGRRRDAAKAYVEASLYTDEVGIVDFDSSARVLKDATVVSGNRDELNSAINGINSSGGTNLGAGLQSGCDLLAGASGERKAAIFFTDGQGSYSGQAQCYADRGWPVYTFGLGSGVNDALLEQIADETGGSYRPLSEATYLVCEFQQVRAEIVGGEVQSCEPFPSIFLNEIRTFIQSVVQALRQITFTTAWQGSDLQMTITSPSGVTYDRHSTGAGVTTLHGPTFETITIVDPEVGDWQVDVLGADIPEGGEPFTFSTLELTGEGDRCFGSIPTIVGDGTDIVGTEGPDVILGTSEAERIDGGGGDDLICAGSGNDVVRGGLGDDRIDGGHGSDRILGGGGDDLIMDPSGSNVIDGQGGDDEITGGGGADQISGSGGADSIKGFAGADVIDGGNGGDSIVGGGGDDLLLGGSGNDRLVGQAGDDDLNGGGGRDFLRDLSGANNLDGGPGNDRCTSALGTSLC